MFNPNDTHGVTNDLQKDELSVSSVYWRSASRRVVVAEKHGGAEMIGPVLRVGCLRRGEPLAGDARDDRDLRCAQFYVAQRLGERSDHRSTIGEWNACEVLSRRAVMVRSVRVASSASMASKGPEMTQSFGN